MSKLGVHEVEVGQLHGLVNADVLQRHPQMAKVVIMIEEVQIIVEMILGVMVVQVLDAIKTGKFVFFFFFFLDLQRFSVCFASFTFIFLITSGYSFYSLNFALCFCLFIYYYY